MKSNCMVAALKQMYHQKGGVIVLMPSLYIKRAKSFKAMWMIWLGGLLMTLGTLLQEGYVLHCAYGKSLQGPWLEFHPTEKKRPSIKLWKVLLFKGRWQPLGRDYQKAYGGNIDGNNSNSTN